MPTRFGDGLGDIDYTLDNYRAPLMIDGRLFLFYEGSTSYEARTGKEKEREKFKINEDGLALTEADPVFDDRYVYVSGKGKIRAVNRRTGKQDWEAADLGICAEMAVIGNVLYVRTGGQFTQLKDGELKEKGPFGVSAINTMTGKTLWRYKGADKGLTNFVFADANTILIADKDDLITIDARTGKAIAKRDHKTDKAQFVLINESRKAIVGGRNEIAAFEIFDPKRPRGLAGPSYRSRPRDRSPRRGDRSPCRSTLFSLRRHRDLGHQHGANRHQPGDGGQFVSLVGPANAVRIGQSIYARKQCGEELRDSAYLRLRLARVERRTR